MGSLIDTSVLVAAERGQIDLEALLRKYPNEEWALAAISAAELLHGVLRAPAGALRSRRAAYVEEKLARFPIVSFELEAARVFARLWARLAGEGITIADRDLMIASTAVAYGFRVATRDLRSFRRIPGLTVIEL